MTPEGPSATGMDTLPERQPGVGGVTKGLWQTEGCEMHGDSVIPWAMHPILLHQGTTDSMCWGGQTVVIYMKDELWRNSQMSPSQERTGQVTRAGEVPV